MTQEEKKQLLMADLSARLQYHVILHLVQQDDEYLYGFRENGGKFMINDAYYIEEVKPYLRPMSSMAEEEITEYWRLEGIELHHADKKYPLNGAGHITWQTFDWLNKKMFDYRGLIPLGLALPAKEGMYK